MEINFYLVLPAHTSLSGVKWGQRLSTFLTIHFLVLKYRSSCAA